MEVHYWLLQFLDCERHFFLVRLVLQKLHYFIFELLYLFSFCSGTLPANIDVLEPQLPIRLLVMLIALIPLLQLNGAIIVVIAMSATLALYSRFEAAFFADDCADAVGVAGE